jgi:hypothetical protein
MRTIAFGRMSNMCRRPQGVFYIKFKGHVVKESLLLSFKEKDNG